MKILVFTFFVVALCLPVMAKEQMASKIGDSWPSSPASKIPKSLKPGLTTRGIFREQEDLAAADERNQRLEVTTDPRFCGTLVYTSSAKTDNSHFIVLHAIGAPQSAKEPASLFASYRAEFSGKDTIHTPLFSPDGKKLLFQQGSFLGSSDADGSLSYLYGWDFGAKQWNLHDLTSDSDGLRWANDSLHFLRHREWMRPDEVWHPMEFTDVAIFDVRDNITRKTGNSVPSYRSPKVFSSRRVRWSEQGTIFGTRERIITDAKPDAVEWVPYTTKINLIATAAFDPVPSPDGRYIAYFGWPGAGKTDNPSPISPAPIAPVGSMLDGPFYSALHPKPPVAPINSTGPFLYLLERKTGHRRVVSLHNSGLVSWSGDGQTLIIVNQGYDYKIHSSTASLSTYSLVQMTDYAVPNAPCKVKEITLPNNMLTVERIVASRHGEQQWLYLDTPGSLQAVNLQSDATVTIARIESGGTNSLNWDWHDAADETVRPIPKIGPPRAKPTKPKAKSK